MPQTLRIHSPSVIIDASPEAVFDTVMDLRNFPKWAYHFCKGIRLVDDGAIVTSPSGEVYFGVTGNRELGVLDWWSGPTKETSQRWPTRVVALPDGRSVYQMTGILSGDAPPHVDQLFADELEALKRLVEERAAVPV